MSSPRPADTPVHSLSARKALRLVVSIPLLTVFVAILLHHKGIVNLEEILGIPEAYLYYGFLGVAILALVSLFCIWKCPGCGAYLGKQTNPTRCSSCEAVFR